MGAMPSQITILTIVYSIIILAQIRENIKLRVTGLCAGNSPVNGEFHAQMARNAENASIWWHHHGSYQSHPGASMSMAVTMTMLIVATIIDITAYFMFVKFPLLNTYCYTMPLSKLIAI